MIDQLFSEIKVANFTLEIINEGNGNALVSVCFNNENAKILLSNEYQDLGKNKLLDYYLFRLSIDNHLSANDYNEWCNDCEFDPTNLAARSSYLEIQRLLDSQVDLRDYILPISNHDYQLNAGGIELLRNYHKR